MRHFCHGTVYFPFIILPFLCQSPLSLSLSHPVFMPKHLNWTAGEGHLGYQIFKSRSPPQTPGQLLTSPTTWRCHRKRPRSQQRPSGIVRLEARTCVPRSPKHHRIALCRRDRWRRTRLVAEPAVIAGEEPAS